MRPHLSPLAGETAELGAAQRALAEPEGGEFATIAHRAHRTSRSRRRRPRTQDRGPSVTVSCVFRGSLRSHPRSSRGQALKMRSLACLQRLKGMGRTSRPCSSNWHRCDPKGPSPRTAASRPGETLIFTEYYLPGSPGRIRRHRYPRRLRPILSMSPQLSNRKRRSESQLYNSIDGISTCYAHVYTSYLRVPGQSPRILFPLVLCWMTEYHKIH